MTSPSPRWIGRGQEDAKIASTWWHCGGQVPRSGGQSDTAVICVASKRETDLESVAVAWTAMEAPVVVPEGAAATSG